MTTLPPEKGVIPALIDDDRNEWTVHTAANGLPYYFNKKTKKSTWEKPDSLKTPEERLNSTDWQEYTTSDGRIFYYNAKLKKSLWNMPPELKAIKEKQAEMRKQMAAKAAAESKVGQASTKISVSITSNIGAGTEDTKEEKKDKYDGLSQDEAERIFLELLKEKANPTLKWDAVHQILMNDERYKVIKSVSEKKKLFKEYVAMVKRQERTDLKNKMDQAKQNFNTMLENCKALTSDSKYHKVYQMFLNDPRWKALEERDRENLFQNYLDELYDKEKEEKRAMKKELSEKLKKMLQDDTKVTAATRWDEICEKYKENHVWTGLQEYDRLMIFSEHIINMEKIENEDKRKNKRLQERKNREAFRELLREQINKAELTHKTKWKAFLESNKSDERFLNLITQHGSTPRELFEDQIELLKESHKKNKDDLKKLLKEVGFKVSLNTKYEEFVDKLKDNPEFQKMEEKTRKYYFDYLVDKAKTKEKESQRKLKKSVKKYNKFLKSLKEITVDSQYKDFENQIKEARQEFILVSDDDKVKYFNEYIQKLKNKDEGQISEEEIDKKKNNKKKKKKNKKKRAASDHSDASDGEEVNVKKSASKEKGEHTPASHSESESEKAPRSDKKKKAKKEKKKKKESSSGSENVISGDEIKKKLRTEDPAASMLADTKIEIKEESTFQNIQNIPEIPSIDAQHSEATKKIQTEPIKATTAVLPVNQIITKQEVQENTQSQPQAIAQVVKHTQEQQPQIPSNEVQENPKPVENLAVTVEVQKSESVKPESSSVPLPIIRKTISKSKTKSKSKSKSRGKKKKDRKHTSKKKGKKSEKKNKKKKKKNQSSDSESSDE